MKKNDYFDALPFAFQSRGGIVFKGERGDLQTRVTVGVPKGELAIDVHAAFAEFGAWHATQIAPRLKRCTPFNLVSFQLQHD